MEMAGTLGIKGFIIKLVCFASQKNKTGVSPMTTKFHPFKMISCPYLYYAQVGESRNV
jgi:hypothetical protein